MPDENSLSVTHVVGNRPHYMKLAPITKALEERGISNEILNTGQHWNDSLSGQFLREFDLEIDYNFKVQPGNHGVQTASMMIELEKHWLNQSQLPEIVLVYGDTNSTLASALVAAKLDIPVAHVEGGVRAEQLETMMPEEINRKLVDDLSRWIYTPTERCADELRREGYQEDRIFNCGDVMFDRLLHTVESDDFVASDRQKSYVLATVHRAENTNEQQRLVAILDSLKRLSEQVDVVLALHPRTEKILTETGKLSDYIDAIEFIPPVGHAEILAYAKNAKFVISDSGGLPKEAAFLGKKSVLLRRQAVWSEMIDQGYSFLADPMKVNSIGTAVESLLASPDKTAAISGFGGGKAANAIADHIVEVMNWGS
ncbi:MAG: UDP-N-acetylglucosamine 2-epimerase (non-hydrolyzing) [Sphingorhabdus sp.]